MNQISYVPFMCRYDQTGQRCGDVIPDVLASAWQSVQSGNPRAARVALAQMVMRYQPSLTANAALLAETVAVLAAAHGVRAISRLLAAASGQWVRVTLTPVPGKVEEYEVMAAGRGSPKPWCTANVADLPALRQWSEKVVERCLPSRADFDLENLLLASSDRCQE